MSLRLGLLSLCLAWPCLTGCDGPRTYFGHQARYAPAYAGYVLGPDEGSDDPEPEEVLVLRDPVDGSKIRCREQLEPYLVAHQDAAGDALHDERWAIASPLIMLPHTVVVAAAGFVLAANAAYAGLPYQLARSKDGFELFAEAEELVDKKRWREACDVLERALIKSPELREQSLALLYLGIGYAETNRHPRARRTLRAFVKLSAVRDADAYRKAERWLAYLGEPADACRSREPVPLAW